MCGIDFQGSAGALTVPCRQWRSVLPVIVLLREGPLGVVGMSTFFGPEYVPELVFVLPFPVEAILLPVGHHHTLDTENTM